MISSAYMDVHVLSSHILGVSVKPAYLIMCRMQIKAYIFHFIIN